MKQIAVAWCTVGGLMGDVCLVRSGKDLLEAGVDERAHAALPLHPRPSGSSFGLGRHLRKSTSAFARTSHPAPAESSVRTSGFQAPSLTVKAVTQMSPGGGRHLGQIADLEELEGAIGSTAQWR